MVPTFLIWFRETLEIAIILSIIFVATRGLPTRNFWVGVGLLGGLVGACVVAVFADGISNALNGMGQEVFNAAALFIAAAMIGWTLIWMQSHGREIVLKVKHVGHKVKTGEMPLYSLAIVVSLAMWREGSEIVLFMYGILNTSTEPMLSIITGGALGFAAAAALGVLLYFGLVRISMRHVFSVSGWLLTLLACGMSAQAMGYLIAADMVPALGNAIWDSSAILSEDSIVGKILHAMVGYTERPAGMQLIAYVATFAILYVASKHVNGKAHHPLPQNA